jgi:large subunit ribosomal protein L3
MIREIYGKKIGMTQVFDGEGNVLAVTLLEVKPVYLLEKIDYSGKVKARIGCFKVEENRIKKMKKPILGYFNSLKVNPYSLIKEVDVEKNADFSFLTKGMSADMKTSSPEKDIAKTDINAAASDSAEKKSEGFPEISREIGVEIFKEGDTIDVRARTKGRGFAGGIKRHHWSGQPQSHGSMTHRRIGSAGSNTFPGRVLKGLRMPGHMGDSYRTMKNLKVFKIDKAKELLFITGSIPGSRGTIVRVKKVS